MSFALMVQTCVSFNVLGFLRPLSYLTLAAFLLMFAITGVVFWREPKLSMFDVCILSFCGLLLSFTLINGTDIKYGIYRSMETIAIVFLFKSYKESMDSLLKSTALVLSLCVYANLAIMIMFPNWLFYIENDSGGFLLGGNYNQMGCRMLVAIVTSCLCCNASKAWVANTILLSIVSLATLLFVGSMTSTFNIAILLVSILVPSLKFRKYIIIGLIFVVAFFQIFIVFGGESLKDNEFAVYIIEEVLHKDITFTYRTYMWDSAFKMFSQSPIIGWGFVDSEWFTANMSSFAVGPHNFIYSIMIFGGVTLLAIYLWAILLAARVLASHYDKRSSIIALGLCTLGFMMIMEMYPFFFAFYMLALAYYYPCIDACLQKKGRATRHSLTSKDSV